jgi:hypothetical protein
LHFNQSPQPSGTLHPVVIAGKQKFQILISHVDISTGHLDSEGDKKSSLKVRESSYKRP